MSAEIFPLKDVVPRLVPNLDFKLVKAGDELAIMFAKCPCCGRTGRQYARGKFVVMEFTTPTLAGDIRYLLERSCAQRLAGVNARDSDLGSKVAFAVLGAWEATRALEHGKEVSALVLDAETTLAPIPEAKQ